VGDGGDSFTAAFRPACFSIWLTLPSSGHRRRGHFDLPESVTKRALPSHCTWYSTENSLRNTKCPRTASGCSFFVP
jgi:hypothetical protein